MNPDRYGIKQLTMAKRDSLSRKDLEAMASQTGPHQGSCALLLKMWPTQKKFDSSDFLQVQYPDYPIPTPAEILTELVPPELLD